MRKKVLTIILLLSSNTLLAQQPAAVVWTGSKDNPTYEALIKNTSGPKVRHGSQAKGNEVQVRPTSFAGFIEVKNKKSNSWLQMRVPAQNSGMIDVKALSLRVFEVSNCDEVKTVIDLTSSTPKTAMHFNSKPIGEVKDNGRFYYESGAVCRNDKIDLIGTLTGCKDFSDSFKAENNPHKYEGKAVPDCSKKTASK